MVSDNHDYSCALHFLELFRMASVFQAKIVVANVLISERLGTPP